MVYPPLYLGPLTDEWRAYGLLSTTGRCHATVNHLSKERARDDDGDGVREVYTNTIEGHWTGLRNFLRMFRGVHKQYFGRYVAFYQGVHNFKDAASQRLRTLLGPVEVHGDRLVRHVFLRRGRIYWQKGREELLREVRAEVGAAR